MLDKKGDRKRLSRAQKKLVSRDPVLEQLDGKQLIKRSERKDGWREPPRTS